MPITLPLNTLPPFTLPTILIDTWKPFYKGFHTTPVIPQRLLGESIVLFFFFYKVMVRVLTVGVSFWVLVNSLNGLWCTCSWYFPSYTYVFHFVFLCYVTVGLTALKFISPSVTLLKHYPHFFYVEFLLTISRCTHHLLLLILSVEGKPCIWWSHSQHPARHICC